MKFHSQFENLKHKLLSIWLPIIKMMFNKRIKLILIWELDTILKNVFQGLQIFHWKTLNWNKFKKIMISKNDNSKLRNLRIYVTSM
jgi:hypothetical protein